ncbi:MAG: lipid-A-disaccharide synthase [Desulfobulbaceae bacterium A2]|nr:MAG: lipid-A-disaccharide synthase [Desulfobulbaceae bacterium A2]
MPPLVMIVAGEASGDLHGARLVQALRRLRPELTFCGMGGPELTGVGVELLCDAARIAVVGVTEVLGHLRDILAARRLLVEAMRGRRPALLVLIDFPDFNLWLARTAKKLGIPIFYYISPQVWAWRSGRVRTIGRLVERIGVILPFEEEFYRQRGVRADFVGHPLLDSVATTMDRVAFCRRHGIDPAHRLVALLPGSRRGEIGRLLPIFLESARRLAKELAEPCTFLLARAPTVTPALLEAAGASPDGTGVDLRIVAEDRYDLMAASDAALAASGTVTLELAILDVPMVVTYRVSPHSYWLGRLLVRVPYFSLVNLVARRMVVPELLQHECSPDNIVRHLLPLLKDPALRADTLAGLAEVRRLLGGGGASERAARIALECLRC